MSGSKHPLHLVPDDVIRVQKNSERPTQETQIVYTWNVDVISLKFIVSCLASVCRVSGKRSVLVLKDFRSEAGGEKLEILIWRVVYAHLLSIQRLGNKTSVSNWVLLQEEHSH